MTDLEKLWADLSTPPAPTDAIVRAARAEAARRERRDRLVRRPLLVAAACAALVGAFTVGAEVGGPGGGGGGPTASDIRPAAFQADLHPATSCEDLLTSYRDRALTQVTPWGWTANVAPLSRLSGRDYVGVAGSVRQPAPLTSSATGTNVRDPEVDEADIVKVDGTRIVRLRGASLVVLDASGTSVVERSRLRIPHLAHLTMLLRGDTVVVLGTDTRSPHRRGSRVVTVSIADEDRPRIVSTVRYSATILSARQHGDAVRLVLSSGLPDLGFVRPTAERSGAEALAANRRAVRESTLDDWLPTVTEGRTTRQLLDCGDVALAPPGLALGTTSITAFDVEHPENQDAIGLAGDTPVAYESSDHLYLAAPAPMWQDGVTQLFDFDLDGTSTSHVASGEVEGPVADRWALDEVDGVLRVAVSPWQGSGYTTSVVTMRREGRNLVPVGRLDGLGSGDDDLKSVRWLGDLAVLVTFRQTDPLYTVDVSDPAHPRQLGALEVPGYSAYLHPVGRDRLLGVGYRGDATQLSLFDLTDRSDVKVLGTQRFRGWRPVVDGETRAFTWLPGKGTAVTILQRGRKVAVVRASVRGGRLSATLTEIGTPVAASKVRTLGLADGRVVLLAGPVARLLP